MDIRKLLKLGQMIRNSSKLSAEFRMKKTAQGWVRPLAGGMAGAVAGSMAGRKLDPSKDSSIPWWSTILGGLGGAAAFSGNARLSPEVLQRIHQWGARGNPTAPIAGSLAGAIAGGAYGEDIGNALGFEEDPTSARVVGALLGGLGGHSVGTGLNRLMANWSVNQARRQAENQYGAQVANYIRDHASRSPAGAFRNLLPSRVGHVLRNDPNNLVGRSLATRRIQELSPANLFATLTRTPQGRRAEEIFRATGGFRVPEYTNMASGLGISSGVGSRFMDTLSENLGARGMKNLQTAGLLGGGYLGASALADIYNRFQGSRNNPNNQNRRIMVL